MANLKLTRLNLRTLYLLAGVIIGIYLFQQGLSPQEKVQSLIKASPAPVVNQASPSAQQNLQNPSGFTPAQVVKVIDGDTIDVQISGETKRVRYIGVNTPETVDPRRGQECFGKEASNENKKLIQGQTVFLEKDVSETDKFGRLLRYVYLGLGQGGLLMVNDYLVRQGYAYSSTYPPDVKHQQRFIEAQQEARMSKRGLWDRCQS